MVIFELCQKFNVKYLESLIVFNILYILKFTINIKGNDFVGFFWRSFLNHNVYNTQKLYQVLFTIRNFLNSFFTYFVTLKKKRFWYGSSTVKFLNGNLNNKKTIKNYKLKK